MKFRADAISADQLQNVVEAMAEVVATRQDLGTFADAIESALPAMVARAASSSRKCAATAFRFIVHRDENGLIDEIIARPEPAA